MLQTDSEENLLRIKISKGFINVDLYLLAEFLLFSIVWL